MYQSHKATINKFQIINIIYIQIMFSGHSAIKLGTNKIEESFFKKNQVDPGYIFTNIQL